MASLFNVQAAKEFTAFDQASSGASAGLNFEHIISGHNDPDNMIAPRKGEYALYRLPDNRSVLFVRDARDCPWRLSSTMKCTVTAPHYIDVEFKCTPHDESRFGKRGYAILFWANYMNDVADVPIHFRGIEAAGGPEKWITGDGPKTHPDWNEGGTYRAAAAPPLEYDDDHNYKLNMWSYEYPRFTRPFYYGLAAHNMVFIIMFDKAYSPVDEIRLSLFKFKLKRFPRPAWDFQYVIHKIEAGKEYGYRARVIWKAFMSPEDCLNEYNAWAARLASPAARTTSPLYPGKS